MIPACKSRLGRAPRIGLKYCGKPVFSIRQSSYLTFRPGANRFPRLAPPSWRARPFDPKDGDAMINDAGKHEVKGEGFVAARRQAEWAPVSRPDGAPKMSRERP